MKATITSAVLLAIFTLTCIFAQDTVQKKVEPRYSATIPLSMVEQKKKDSMMQVATNNLEVAINLTTKIPQKKRELLVIKEREQKAMREYINMVNTYLKTSGRTEKIIVKKDLKQQLQDGEIFLVKDSTCTGTKKSFLGKPKCTQWKYTFYLQDKKGHKEQLF